MNLLRVGPEKEKSCETRGEKMRGCRHRTQRGESGLLSSGTSLSHQALRKQGS